MKIVVLALAATCIFQAAAAAENTGELLRSRTQQLYDAVAPGDRAPWERYADERASFTDENGVLRNKKELLDTLEPLPAGLSGSIEITDWRVTIIDNAAITTYVADEHENYYGQHLHALYRMTDTWLRERGDWRLVAEQTIALQQDPPAMALPASLLDQYVGRYAAAPDFIYTISRNGDQLMGASGGGKPQTLKAELADVLFTPGQPRVRKIFVRDAKGDITGFLSRREERDVIWTKLK